MNSFLAPLTFLKIMIMLHFNLLHIWTLIFLHSLLPTKISNCIFLPFFLKHFMLSTENIYHHRSFKTPSLSITVTVAGNPRFLRKLCLQRLLHFCFHNNCLFATSVGNYTPEALFLCTSGVDQLFSRSQVFLIFSLILSQEGFWEVFSVCMAENIFSLSSSLTDILTNRHSRFNIFLLNLKAFFILQVVKFIGLCLRWIFHPLLYFIHQCPLTCSFSLTLL